MKRLVILTLFLSFLITQSQEDISLDVSSISDELLSNSNAVIRLEEQFIEVNSQDDMVMSYRRIVTVLNEKGDVYVGAIAGYNNYTKIKKIEAVIYDKKGNEIKKIKKKDFIDHSAVDGGTLYSDSRVLYMSYNSHSYPYTVEFTVEYRTPNTAGIPSWRPMSSYNLSLEESKFSIVDNANIGLRYIERNFEGFSIEKNNQENALNYSIKNIPAYIREDLSPSLSMVLPKVMVAVTKFHYYGVNGEASNWEEFGSWVEQSLLKGRDQVSPKTRTEILELTKGLQDPIEKAKVVYDYVQNNTRYISVQVGIGGIQPISALEVDQVKYGDCKGLTNYTHALLRVVGVESYYTHVEAGNERVDFDPDFASLEQGNHIILAIPSKDNLVWLDCTSQIHPFGFIGDFTDNRSVLIITPEGGKIVRTVDYTNADNKQVTTGQIKLNENASIQASVVVKTKGIQYDNRFYIERESKDNIEKFYKTYWNYLNDMAIDSYKFSNNKESVEFSEELVFSARDYASKNSNRLIFNPNVFDRNLFVPDRYRNRKLPFVIERGYLDEDHFSITIPENYQIESIPADFHLETKFGIYDIKFARNGNVINYTRTLQINEGSYSREEYKAYRDFRKDVSKQDNSIISLILEN